MTVSPISSSSAPPVSIGGISSGLPTTQIISAYLQIDEAPLIDLENQQTALGTKIAAYQNLQSQLTSLQTSADAISTPNAFASDVSASSSNSAVATATTGPGAVAGSTTFSVVQLAAADTLVSSGTVASASDVVASGNLLLASGGSGLGIASLSGSGLALGAHTIAVTQASAGATVTGTSALSSTTSIVTGSNDQLSVSIDGTQHSFTLAAGSYTEQQLAAAVTTSSGGLLSASVGQNGMLQLATVEQGSQASLQVNSGSANAALGLSAGSAVNGTNGIVTVDGTATTVTDIAASGQTAVTLASGSGGSVVAQLSPGGLQIGSITAQNVSVGNGSLSSVVSAINGSGVGVTAQALQVGQNQFALEVASNTTGAANDVSIDPSAFAGSGLGALQTTTAGQDAVVSLGGAGGYQVHSSSNTVTGLMPGVSINLASTSSAPVTVTVGADGPAAAAQVQSFVNSANTVLQAIAGDVAYDPQSKTAGPLNGDVALESLAQRILSTVGQAIGTSGLNDGTSAGSAAGLSLNSNGTLNFNATTFAQDFQQNPTKIASLFTQGGSFTPAGPAAPSDVTFSFATDSSQPGSYAVSLSQSAAQATDTGTATFSSPAATVGAAETYTVSSGGTNASYGIAANESLTAVAQGLDGAFAAAGLNLSAQVVTQGSTSSVQITSANYGSAVSFSVSSSGSDQLGLDSASPFSGTDVAGTINGVAATGSGQYLSAPSADPTLAGLSLRVATPGITSSTPIGTFTYAPGLAQGVATVAAQVLASPGGQITSTIANLQSNQQEVGSQVSIEQQIVVEQQAALTQEFNNLETTLTALKAESAYITSAFGGSSSGLLSALTAGGTQVTSSSSSSPSGTTGG